MRTKKLLLVLLVAAFVLGLGSLATTTQASPAPQAASVSLKVLNPQGMIPVVNKFAPRLSTLDGKTVALWYELAATYEFQNSGKTFFEDMAAALKKQFPTVKVVMPDQFKNDPDAAIAVPSIQAAKPDAAILGVGG